MAPRIGGFPPRRGHRYYTAGASYIWAFDDVYEDGSYYDTYYLFFKSGRLYSW